ncbi:putative phage tail protein (plasmid) [Selenomonas ruminantium subsp. lactilytica TAM6421]|uniref:Putative phage tail protein n=1 Tax=Selenomonas ruminantium subsp. lactilytica (strain NBRC 103574 / TAM6421) TaxID=927704 RepID=I0GVA9_SELRL|nr:putative phage tail protein [Selenomonas ruminantium]BAL84696.1 putative phage tail protein [Selenomonas ruminantium subsp. lactilytica TAM6421]
MIAENLRWLKDTLDSVSNSDELSAIRDDIQNMYNDMRTNEKFGSIEATEQAKIATEQASVATEKAVEAAQALSDMKAETSSVADNMRVIKNNIADIKKYLEEIAALQKDVADNAQVATNHAGVAKTKAAEAAVSETNAKNSADNASLSEANAKTSENKALASEKAAKTSETNAKASETASKASETNAKNSETASKASETASSSSASAAKTSETNAKASETASKASETAAKASEANAKASEQAASASESKSKTSEANARNAEAGAKTSETNAKNSETASKASEKAAKTSEENAQKWSEGTPDSTIDSDGNVINHYSSKHHAEQSTLSASEAKASATNAKTAEANAKSHEQKSLEYRDSAGMQAKNAKDSAKNAKDSETNAKEYESKSKEHRDDAMNWAEGSIPDSVDENGNPVKHCSAKHYAESANDCSDKAKASETQAKASETKAAASESSAKKSETNSKTSETNAKNSEAKARSWAESSDVVETETVSGETINHYSSKHYALEAEKSYNSASASETAAQSSMNKSKEYMEKAAKSETNAKASENLVKGYSDSATASANTASEQASAAKTSETNAANSASLAKKWAMSDTSPDGGFDAVGTGGKTQSAKTWATQAKEQAVSATNKAAEASEYTKTVKDVLKQAQSIQATIASSKSAMESLAEQTKNALSESKSIRDSLSDVVKYKGSVENYSDLPKENNKIGDMYNVKNADKANGCNAGDNVVWNGTGWDNLGGFIDVDDILNGGKNAKLGEVIATSFTGKLIGNADTATTADSAKSVAWANVSGKPTSMPANGGTADRALKADVCTGNAASASSVAWANVSGKPTSFTPASHNHDSSYPSTTGTRASGTWEISITGKAATAGTADTATALKMNEGTNDKYRPVWFEDGVTKYRTNYNDKFQYNPATDSLKVGSITGKAATAGTADSAKAVAWGNVSGKPSTYPATAHNHDSSYPSTTGTRATGTWGISISGKAATAGTADVANSVSWANVSGKPSSMAANGGTSSYTNNINITRGNEIVLNKNGQNDGGDYWFGYRNDGATKATTSYIFGDGLAKGGLANLKAKTFIGSLQGNATSASSVAWGNVTGKPSSFTPASHNHDGSYPSKTGSGASGTWGINVTGSAGSVAWGNVSGRPSSLPANGGTSDVANKIAGTYSGSGGCQGPGYYGRYRAGFLMSNQSINGDSSYKNWLYMDNYGSDDAGGTSAIGVSRAAARAFIMSSDKNRTSWNWSAELLSTANYNSYAPTKTGSGASGTWGISISGKAATAGTADKANAVAWGAVSDKPATATRWPSWGEVTGKPSTYTPSSHTHAWSQVTGAPATATRWPSWSEVTGKPSVMTTGGGTFTGNIVVPTASSSWRDGRTKAAIRTTSINGYTPVLSAKTTNGSWDYGVYDGNIAHFTYFTDDNYNKNNNTQTVDVQLKPNGEVQAPAFRGRLYGTADAANSVAWANVSGKPSTFTPASHTHAWSQVTGAPATATRWPSWGEVTGKPSSFTPASHNQAWSTITDKPAQATRWPSWSEVTGKPTSLPANGGNADSVGGVTLNDLYRTLSGRKRPQMTDILKTIVKSSFSGTNVTPGTQTDAKHVQTDSGRNIVYYTNWNHIQLTQPFTNFDKILIITSNGGDYGQHVLWESWELAHAISWHYRFALLKDTNIYWWCWGAQGTNHPHSDTTNFYCQNSNINISGIFGINYA